MSDQVYVCGFLFDETRKKVVLIEKNRPAWQKGRYNGVGGKFESPDVFSEVTMSREFFEETGVQIPREKWKLFCQYFFRGGLVNFYYCWDEFGQYFNNVKSVTDEQLQVFSVNDLPKKSIYNLHWLIPLANDPSLDFSRPMSWITISE